MLTAAATKSLQLCLTLCNPTDGLPPGSPVPGILQARTLEWVAISFSSAWKQKVNMKLLSHVRLLVTPWTAAYQAPLSMRVFRQEYWSGLPLLSPKCLLQYTKLDNSLFFINTSNFPVFGLCPISTHHSTPTSTTIPSMEHLLMTQIATYYTYLYTTYRSCYFVTQ